VKEVLVFGFLKLINKNIIIIPSIGRDKLKLSTRGSFNLKGDFKNG